MFLLTFGTDVGSSAGCQMTLRASSQILSQNSWKYRCPEKSRKFDSLLCSIEHFGANREGEYFGSKLGILRKLPRCCCIYAPRCFQVLVRWSRQQKNSNLDCSNKNSNLIAPFWQQVVCSKVDLWRERNHFGSPAQKIQLVTKIKLIIWFLGYIPS